MSNSGVKKSATQYFFRGEDLLVVVEKGLVHFAAPIPIYEKSKGELVSNWPAMIGSFLRDDLQLASVKNSHYENDNKTKYAYITMSEGDCETFLKTKPLYVGLDKGELANLKKKVDDAKTPKVQADASTANHDDTLEPPTNPKKQR